MSTEGSWTAISLPSHLVVRECVKSQQMIQAPAGLLHQDCRTEANTASARMQGCVDSHACEALKGLPCASAISPAYPDANAPTKEANKNRSRTRGALYSPLLNPPRSPNCWKRPTSEIGTGDGRDSTFTSSPPVNTNPNTHLGTYFQNHTLPQMPFVSRASYAFCFTDHSKGLACSWKRISKQL